MESVTLVMTAGCSHTIDKVTIQQGAVEDTAGPTTTTACPDHG